MVPGEIHPATRNMLQGEVARTYGTEEGRKRAPMRLRWLPALAWIAILAAIPLFFLPHSPETKKTQEALPSKENEVVLPTQSKPGEAPIQLSDTRTPVKPPEVAPVMAPAPAAREELAVAAERDTSVSTLRARNMTTKKMETRQISKDAAAPAPVDVAPTPTTAPVMREEAQVAGGAGSLLMQRSRSVEAVPKSEVSRAAAEPAPTGTVTPAAAVANSQRFSFVNNSATPQALNKFQIEQAGTRFRVVDSDGSIYFGRGSTNGAFHVAGEHRTSKQFVDFTGQVMRASLVISTNQQQQAPQQITTTANSAAGQNQIRSYLNNASNQSLNNLSNNSDELRVQGQALIGNNQYKVDAQATPGQ